MKRFFTLILLLVGIYTYSIAEDVTVYFVNTEGWSTPYAYVWPDGGTGLVSWPGEKMKRMGYSNVYSYTFDYAKAQNIIFNDYGSYQTYDLIVDKEKTCYVFNRGWISIILDNTFCYSLDNNKRTAEVVACLTSGNVTIPSSITYNSETYSVTSIGDWAFEGCSGLTSVTIGNSVTSINSYAFYDCSGLTSVTIPNSVTSIGDYAFDGCSGLTKVNYLGSVDKWVGIDFSNYSANPTYYAKDLYINDELLTDVKISKADSIKECAFYNCKSIKSVEIGNSVTSIGDDAFVRCSGLTSVTIPNSVTSIGDYAFDGCSGLTSVTIGNSVTSIGDWAFSGCSGLTSVTIGNSVTSIGDWAFYDCSGLTSVTIPNSVTSIGSRAFYNCSGLTSVTIPNSVTSIGIEAFYKTVFYNTKNWEDGVLYIDNCLIKAKSDVVKGSYSIKEGTWLIADDAFYGCSGLTSVTIPNSVTSIGESAFYNCSGLTSVTIGNSVTSIVDEAFYNCSGLTSVTIGNSVTSIGDEAFYRCSSLTKVNYLGSVDKWVGIDFSSSSDNPTYYAKDLYINGELLTDVKISTADSIKKYAFYNCASIKSVELGNSVTSIGSSAFVRCSGLTSVTIGNSVTSIGRSAFYDCSGLTSVAIPNSVTSIGEFAFSYCSGLTSVTIPNSVTSIGGSAFRGCSVLTKVNYLGSVDKWVGIDFSSSSDNPTYYAKDLYINGELLTDVKISTADNIKKYAFYNCASIKSVELGNSVTSIVDEAFYNCSGLTSVTIGNSVTSIGDNAFEGCSGLTSVVWNVKNFADFSNKTSSPFYNLRSIITSFTFGNEVEHIPAYLCYDMTGLKELTIPNSVKSIGASALYCSGLTKVNYLGSVDMWVGIDFSNYSANPTYYAKDLYINDELLTDVKISIADSIKKYAFYNCVSIKSVEIGNSVTSIGSSAFYNCSGLTSIIIPNSVTSIGDEAFYRCSSLTKVNYLGSVDKWVDFDWNYDNDNPTYYAKDLYINDELLTDVKISTADSIKKYAFYNCASIKSVEIGNSVTTLCSNSFSNCETLTSVTLGENVKEIGSYAFSGCEKLRKVVAYPTTVPTVYTSSFAHYNAALYVPCDVYDDYFFDDVFGTFKVTECIAAEEVDATDKVEIEVDEDNNAIVTWPSTTSAKTYELEISKDGEVFCTLLFNANGQLTSIDFGNRSAEVGFQFTVTGLDAASKYNYQMVAMDKKGNELVSYKGVFATNGYEGSLDDEEGGDTGEGGDSGEDDDSGEEGGGVETSVEEILANANITISEGTISCPVAEFTIYNVAGQNVTALNGSLNPGVYVVQIENNFVKVMVK